MVAQPAMVGFGLPRLSCSESISVNVLDKPLLLK